MRGWAPPRARARALGGGGARARAGGRELAVALVGAAESRALNARFRGRDTPTNVLSFPAAPLPARRDVRACSASW